MKKTSKATLPCLGKKHKELIHTMRAFNGVIRSRLESKSVRGTHRAQCTLKCFKKLNKKCEVSIHKFFL